MTAWVYEVRHCPTLPNEIKKTKLDSNTEPQAGINILLCTVPRLHTLNHTDASALDVCQHVWHWHWCGFRREHLNQLSPCPLSNYFTFEAEGLLLPASIRIMLLSSSKFNSFRIAFNVNNSEWSKYMITLMLCLVSLAASYTFT